MAAREAMAAVLLLAPLAAAHGDAPERLYDPLTPAVEGWLAADGEFALQPPPAGFAAFPDGPAPLRWDLLVPIAASLLGGTHALLLLRADQPALARAPDNALLEAATTLDGEPVPGTATVVTAPEVPLQPGKVYALDAHANATALAWRAGQRLGLQVAFLGTAPLGMVGLVLGGNGSRGGFTARASTLDDLGHEHAGWQHVRVDEFEERLRVTTEPVMDLDVHHGDAPLVAQAARAGTSLTVRIENAETPEQGATHGPWGTDAPHVVHMTGLGLDERFDLFPGEVLLRTFRLAQAGTLEFRCERVCGTTAPFGILTVQAASAGERPGAQRVRIEPGKFFESNLQLREGEQLRWSFSAQPAEPVSWDIHSHPGNQVVVHDSGDAPAANGTFTAPSAGVYSLLLQNSNPDPLDVTYTVEGGVPYEPPPKGALPLDPWLLLPASLAAALLAGRRRDGRA
jgi:hypothetical protein